MRSRLALPLLATLALVTFAGVAPAPAGTASAPAPASAPGTFKVDSTHSKAFFGVRHLGAGNFYGRFNDVSGSFTHDIESGVPSFNISIAVESVDTANETLDNHLRSPDFFNAREFESMTFRSTSATKAGDQAFDVTGDLTIHGVTKEVTVRLDWVGAAEISPQMGYRCGFETKFEIDRTEFGMEYGVSNGMLGKDVQIIVSLEGVRE